MVWHFFKKDFRLLWPMALALAAVQALCAARTWVLGHFSEPTALHRLTSFLPVLVFLGIVLVTVSAVHQDPLPGVRQDWLTRPVRRRDVWLSKVLFVLLLVVAPIFAIDVVEQLSVQLPLSMSIAGAASRALLLFGGLALPALVLGAVTRSLTEALVVAIVAAIALSTLGVFGPAALFPEAVFSAPPGTQWIPLACAFLVMMVAAAVVLWFQHTYRRTGVARVMALVGALLTTLTLVALPASAALQIQRWTWGRAADEGLSVHFDPHSQASPPGKRGEPLEIQSEPAPRNPAVIAGRKALFQAGKSEYAKLLIPLRIEEGIAQDDILHTDQLSVRITAADGTVYFDDRRLCLRHFTFGADCRLNWIEAHADESRSPRSPATAHLALPTALYRRLKDDAVNLQLNYSLTSFTPDPEQRTGTHTAARQLSHLGSCATRIAANGDEVELRCLTSAKAPSCIAATLEDPQTEKRNPELTGCLLDYAPFRLQPSMDVVRPLRISLPFRDPTGLAKFPVNTSAIERAQVRLTTFAPVTHFSGSLSIQNVRLSEWEASQVLKSSAEPGR
jgi:hypothetical protein